ncbi:DUF4054 domain-containing protein [Yersinia enterocolitica]|uniref:DUF4054 domain-containing protein n=1 Tax=Yersinia TaxID=629 RepID=UPI0002F5BC3A|nr:MULTISPECIES: DUF4054 domain-containing protein [Yersinia]PEH52756.1 DUF4054 domain-containing protein [Yersinia kristensenii]CNK98410.1 Uncharacterised protein [Yersinia enterocolitica]SUP70610.1 Uncharacterised protein [Yersinia kristensenii]
MVKNSKLPTVEQFRADFPEFADNARYPSASIQFYLNAADSLLDQDKMGDKFVYLAELFTAHYSELRGKIMIGAIAGGVNTSTGGVVSSKSVDKVSVGYDNSGIINPDAGFWNKTAYGQEFYWWWSMFGAGGRQLL